MSSTRVVSLLILPLIAMRAALAVHFQRDRRLTRGHGPRTAI